MSISKKLAAIVSAAAVVASMFAVATPASAESMSAFINRTVTNDVDRTLDPTNHTVKYYAGENFSLYSNGAVKGPVLASKVAANSVVTIDSGWTVVSGTLPTTLGKLSLIHI